MDLRTFRVGMDALVEELCATRSLGPLRTLLPHWPMPNGFTDELVGLAEALKTVRVQQSQALSAKSMELVVALQQAAESGLVGKR
jgi:hypothetical protein